MAIKYNVTHYSFKEPSKINEFEYNQLKQRIQNDPNFTLIDEEETITNKFSMLFKILTGAIICIPIVIIVFKSEIDALFFIVIIGFLWIFFGFMTIMMSLTTLASYALYLKKKRSYLKRMEDSIRKSETFNEFTILFYEH